MATVVMEMSGYGIEHESPTPETYCEEVMQSGWNPQLGLMEVPADAVANKRAILDPGLVTVDVDTFLQKMHCHQR